MLNREQNLIENVERNQQQAEPGQREKAGAIRRQDQRNQEIAKRAICERSCKPNGGGAANLVGFCPRILCNATRKGPIRAHQSHIAQDDGPQEDRGKFAPAEGPRMRAVKTPVITPQLWIARLVKNVPILALEKIIRKTE